MGRGGGKKERGNEDRKDGRRERERVRKVEEGVYGVHMLLLGGNVFYRNPVFTTCSLTS